MEKNETYVLKNGKERNVPNGKERYAQPCQYVYIHCTAPQKCATNRRQFMLGHLVTDFTFYCGIRGENNCNLVTRTNTLAFNHRRSFVAANQPRSSFLQFSNFFAYIKHISKILKCHK